MLLNCQPQKTVEYDIDRHADYVSQLAYQALYKEVSTFPKPGLVSHIDNGAHRDMNGQLLEQSALVLQPFFKEFYQAGLNNPTMDQLRLIGMRAEKKMLHATQGINTHRGAIFAMGLICAALGFRQKHYPSSLLNCPSSLFIGKIIADKWGADIINGPIITTSHGNLAAKLYGAGGARLEAANGLPTIYNIALPALDKARTLNPCHEAQRVHVIMALIAHMQDTNLLYRGGMKGMIFAQNAARIFLQNGSIANHHWKKHASIIHQRFITRNLSPGGAADMLAATLLIDQLEKV